MNDSLSTVQDAIDRAHAGHTQGTFKPRIRLDPFTLSTSKPLWVCDGMGVKQACVSPKSAYEAWRRESVRSALLDDIMC